MNLTMAKVFDICDACNLNKTIAHTVRSKFKQKQQRTEPYVPNECKTPARFFDFWKSLKLDTTNTRFLRRNI